VTAKHQVPSGQIPEDEPGQGNIEGIDGYGGKDFEKREVLRREWKTPSQLSTTGPQSLIYDNFCNLVKKCC